MPWRLRSKLRPMARFPGMVVSRGLAGMATWILGPLALKKQIHGADQGMGHVTGSSGWLPPQSSWDGGGTGLPYGWEAATDKEGRTYYVNHVNKTSTYEDPRKWGTADLDDNPEPREVTLDRHAELGFGFVAGSEKPVIVRFVTGGGPSVDKLMPGDQILSINGEDVARAPRDHVIQLVRSCRETVTLVVCQPPLDNSASRKSALLSAAKKAKLKSNPSRVRFAESVDINGSPLFNPSTHSAMTSADSVMPLMPNVLKVFLENGQTKSFKYDSTTTVQDVLDSLQVKLGITAMSSFSLVVEHVKSLKRNKLTLLNPKDTLSKIASRPGAHNLRCLFRVTFVPKDAYELLRKDSVAFEYLFVQCCNDVVQERFSPELKYEVALRLAALHLHQHAIASGLVSGNKVTVKAVEKESGLERFIPASLVETMKKKELRKLLTHFLKLNQNLVANGQKSLTGLQAKLHYLKIVSELPSYGAKCFSTTLNDSNSETVILVSQKFGISQIDSLRTTLPVALCDIEGLESIQVSREDEVTRRVLLNLKDPDKEPLVLLLEERDAEELVLVLQGYYLLLTDRSLSLIHVRTGNEEIAPPYCGLHTVAPQGWNYPGKESQPPQVDLGAHPPYHPPPEGFKVPNIHPSLASSDSGSGSDGDTSMHSSTENRSQGNLDRNRNITVEENANLTGSPRLYTTFGDKYAANGGTGHHHGLPNGGPAYPPSILKKRGQDDGQFEAKNDEVIRRVVEMKQILQSAELYLNEGELTDAESVLTEKSNTESELSSNYGKLKHSDSLLLLAQEKEDEEEDEEEEEEEAVTEAVNDQLRRRRGQEATPPPPPPPKSILKHSDSSFGLHSPDSLNDDVQMLLKKFKENPNLSKNLTDSHVVLDPDLIDLTLIPPPMTPDEDGAGRPFPGSVSTVSTPPTPFADRESLEAELLAIEKEIGSLRLSRGQFAEDATSLTSLTMPELTEATEGAAGPGLAAFRHLRSSEDIESFIANMAVPPPPSLATKQVYKQHSPVVELTTEDISAFIIPPPPGAPATNTADTTTVSLRKRSLGRPTPDGPPSFTEREIQEVKVATEHLELQREAAGAQRGSTPPPPKVATLQERISQLRLADNKVTTSAKLPANSLGLHLQKDSFGYPLAAEPPAKSPLRSDISSAVAPMAHRGNSGSEQAPPPPFPRGQGKRREVFMRQVSSPDMTVKPFVLMADMESPVVETSGVPPPPPPRATLPGGFGTLGRKQPPSRYQFGNTPLLIKSNSQDDLRTMMLATVSAPVHRLTPVTSTTSTTPSVRVMASRLNKTTVSNSSSTEDLDTKRSPLSPSKVSLTSSSDSLSSTTSVATVKSISPAAEIAPMLPPSLPPRPSPTKSSANVLQRPPLPPLVCPGLADKAVDAADGASVLPAKLVSNSPFRTGQLSPVKTVAALPSRKNSLNLDPPLLPTTPGGGNPPPGSPKPVLPARTGGARSSVMDHSPAKASPGRSLPQIPPASTAGSSPAHHAKPAAPTPPESPRLSGRLAPGHELLKHSQSSPHHSGSSGHSPLVQRRSSADQSQRVSRHVNSRIADHTSSLLPPTPTKGLTATERLTGGRKLPVPPPNSSTPVVTSPPKSTSYAQINGQAILPVPAPPPPPNSSAARFAALATTSTTPPSPKSILRRNGHHHSTTTIVNGSNHGEFHHHHRYLNGLSDVYTNSDFDDSSLEGTSVDEPESLLSPDDDNNDALKQAGRMLVFRKAEEVVSHVTRHLQESRALCQAGEAHRRDEEKFLRAKEHLTMEARQFVTASKLFVKSATESEGQLMECLNHCVHMIDKIGNIARDCAMYTTTPGQTAQLISKVQDVADTYLQTLQAASAAIGKDMNDPSMNILMKRATALAGVLTTLMRSLRVFS